VKGRKNLLIGIGGVGMSALAQILLDKGESVAGVDRMIGTVDESAIPPSVKALEAQGVPVSGDGDASAADGIERIVVSTAIESDHPILLRAAKENIPVVHRSEALAQALGAHKLLAVAGTCGKSTVTAILGHILEGCGFDPVVVNGAAIPGWDFGDSRVGSVRKPSNPLPDESLRWAVAEVDESDKSLTAFKPDAAVITNASADHFGIEETLELFDVFKKNVPGPVDDGRDGGSPQEIELGKWSGSFVENGIRYTIPQPGIHNVYNAWHAVKIATAIGADGELVKKALATFPGVARRMQKVGELADGSGRKVAIVDDYAHNTEKLHAMWQALSSEFPGGFAAVWRPHGYAPLRKMLEPLAEMFKSAVREQDTLFILPVYDAGGSANRDINSGALIEKLSGSCKGTVKAVADLDEAEKQMRETASSVEALVTVGARDPGLCVLAKKLAEKI
jgi:UDP-N-acetylmuramate--alanine ligase